MESRWKNLREVLIYPTFSLNIPLRVTSLDSLNTFLPARTSIITVIICSMRCARPISSIPSVSIHTLLLLVSEWMSEWVSEWVSVSECEWVSEWVSECRIHLLRFYNQFLVCFVIHLKYYITWTLTALLELEFIRLIYDILYIPGT